MKYAHLESQWTTMLERGIIPCFEFELTDGEFLLVDISFCDDGLYFEFDENNLKTWFSGDVIKYGGGYKIKFNGCFDNLDYYLREIYTEVMDGFVIPNNLYDDIFMQMN